MPHPRAAWIALVEARRSPGGAAFLLAEATHASPEVRGPAMSALAVLVVGLVTAAVTWLVVYLRGEGHLTRLLQKMAQIINQARATLPASVTESLPDNADELREAAVHWLESHARGLQTAGEDFGRAVAHILIGLVVGGSITIPHLRRAYRMWEELKDG